MGAARKLVNEAEYLAAERLAEEKHEYIDGAIYAMAGASYVHNVLSANLMRHLGNQLAAGPCRPLAADMRVYARGAWLYPDVVVHCGPPEFVDNLFDTLTNPSVVIEILSDSTERNDRGPKFRKYESIESVNEIVFVAQEEPRIEHFARLPDGSWRRVLARAGERVAFPSLNIDLGMDEIYSGVPLAVVPNDDP